jgi:hypothetical protein
MGDWHNHIKHLEEEHRVLELRLNEMEKHPYVEESNVAEIKKQKLQLKDDIQRLQLKHKDD